MEGETDMTKTITKNSSKPYTPTTHRAGDIKKMLTGTETYLAPLPLPTDAQPYCPYISDFNDVYLDFGGGSPTFFLISCGWAGL